MQRSDRHNTQGDDRAATLTELREQAAALKEDAGHLGDLVRQVAEETLHEVREKSAHKVDETRQVAEDRARDVRDSAQSVLESGRGTLASAEHRLTDQVRSNPTRSLLIAAGIGAVLGLLSRRR
ncbi:MAG: DUF883 C-terminal domain-containing protein [Candidatus Eiseniibacteriota bacterium]|jgi:ElaB/YqjD/DUF883 family membrane-anchored ribosome-binding protein